MIQSERDYLIWENDKVKDWDKMRVAEDFLLSGKGSGDKKSALRSQIVREWNAIIVYFNQNDNNLLQKEELQEIQKIENHIKNMEEWQYLCYATSP